MVLVPLLHAGRPAGVLKVYSAEPGKVGANEARVLGLLGNVIGTGLARAELFATMTEHAVTDALTGLANRRSWDEQLSRAIAHAERTHETLSVAVCDVAACLTYKAAYALVGWRASNTWVPYLRADWRDALHQNGANFVYVSKLARATVGVRAEIGDAVIFKAEYTFNHELGAIPQFPDDILTTSLVVKF